MSSIVKDTLEWLSAAGVQSESGPNLALCADKVEKWTIEEVREFKQAALANDVEGMLDAIVDAQWIINNLAKFAGFSIEQVQTKAEAVRKSNFSKFCKTREEAQQSVAMYAEGTHPNKLGEKITTIYRTTGNEKYPYVLLRADDGKILKSHNFKDVEHFNDEK